MAGQRNGRVAVGLLVVAVLMLGASFAAVPFYNWFCQVTGFGGTVATAEAPTAAPLDRTVVVRFDANTAPDQPMKFRPMQRTMKVRLGETALAFYEAENTTDAPIAGTASYNVAPFSAGGYFAKIACFCFEMQVLQPGERVEMPVSFFVDPAMVEDREAGEVHRITLSYTMHHTDMPEQDDALVRAEAPRDPTTSPTIEN